MLTIVGKGNKRQKKRSWRESNQPIQVENKLVASNSPDKFCKLICLIKHFINLLTPASSQYSSSSPLLLSLWFSIDIPQGKPGIQ